MKKHTRWGSRPLKGFRVGSRDPLAKKWVFCNEKLQQLFIELVLKQQQEEYEREGE